MTYIISDNCLQISDSYRYSKHDMIPSLNLIKERYPFTPSGNAACAHFVRNGWFIMPAIVCISYARIQPT